MTSYIENCTPSPDTDTDWKVSATEMKRNPPREHDLREDWWTHRQQTGGSCVGFAIADGLLRWHYVKEDLINEDTLTSPRFIWMAAKETDKFESHPTTFIDRSGTHIKAALKIARKYGCVNEDDLPMSGGLSTQKTPEFYEIAGRNRILSYRNLGVNLATWRQWIAQTGPVAVRLVTDETFINAAETGGNLDEYKKIKGKTVGHNVVLVGYTRNRFIVRNSWSKTWGKEGFAFASNNYAEKAFTEAYGVKMPQRNELPL